MKYLKTFLCFNMIFGLIACTNFSKPDIINAVVFKNGSSSSLQDVSLKVPQTGQIIACSTIPVHGECSVGLPEREDKKMMLFLVGLKTGIHMKRICALQFHFMTIKPKL